MDHAATLSEHHAPFANDGYVTHDRFIFVNSFGARYLTTAKDENPKPHISRNEDHSSEYYVALIIVLIMLVNQHGDAFKQQADAKKVNTHQAVLFASSTQPSCQALFAATVSTWTQHHPQ